MSRAPRHARDVRRHDGVPRAGRGRGRAGRGDVAGLPAHDEIENVVVLGMGGSGIAGDVVLSVAGPFMAVARRRVQELRAAELRRPDDAVHRALVLGQHRGDGRGGADRGARRRAHGRRRRAAASWRGSASRGTRRMIGVPDGIPMPRAGLGAMAIPPLLVLEHVGLFPGAPRLDRPRRRAAATPARPAVGGRQPGALAGPPHRPHDADRLRRRRARRGRGAALEERVQRERRSRRRSSAPCPS